LLLSLQKFACNQDLGSNFVDPFFGPVSQNITIARGDYPPAYPPPLIEASAVQTMVWLPLLATSVAIEVMSFSGCSASWS
jgi:hypothetical protein